MRAHVRVVWMQEVTAEKGVLEVSREALDQEIGVGSGEEGLCTDQSTY